MKKFSLLMVMVLIASITFMTSCKDEENPDDLKPTLNFKGGQGFISQDATLEVLEQFTIGVIAVENNTSNKKLTNLNVKRTYNNADWFNWDTAINVTTYDINIIFAAINQVGTEKITFTITDADGRTNEISLNITTEQTAGPINFYQQKVLGSWSSVTGSSFASIDGTIYSMADAFANQGLVDWLYFYGASNEATIAAPDDTDAADVFTNPQFGLDEWTTKNETRFKKLDETAITWDDIVDDTIILAQTADGVTESKINMLAVGDILGFETVTGKKGMIKVDAITVGADGTMEISVKVQQ